MAVPRRNITDAISEGIHIHMPSGSYAMCINNHRLCEFNQACSLFWGGTTFIPLYQYFFICEDFSTSCWPIQLKICSIP